VLGELLVRIGQEIMQMGWYFVGGPLLPLQNTDLSRSPKRFFDRAEGDAILSGVALARGITCRPYLSASARPAGVFAVFRVNWRSDASCPCSLD